MQPSLLPRQFPATPQQVLGPYFLSQSPQRINMFPTGASGSEISISGQVLSVDGKALTTATIHVWVADPTGKYDNQDAQGNPLAIPPAQHRYRGRVVSDKSGQFTFNCLRPGNYFDGGWKLWRPAHIHIKVEAKGYKTLVTQLYFHDDAHNTHDIPGDDFFLPELVVQTLPAIATAGVVQKGIFNFVLTK